MIAILGSGLNEGFCQSFQLRESTRC
jgi:hypothetical protein